MTHCSIDSTQSHYKASIHQSINQFPING